MMRNIELTRGLVFSQALLLHLANLGMSREQAYALVQASAMKSISEGSDFKQLILADEQITNLMRQEQIEDIFSYDRYLKNVDFIYKRCGILA
jgi:adenylosuccinate lyase